MVHEAAVRARAVLVFGGKVATVAEILARAIPLNPDRLTFSGPVSISPRIRDHYAQTILPLVDSICEGLGLDRQSFEVSIVNLSAGSALNTTVSIDGYSADVPVFLAILSAATGIALPPHVATTGHIASYAGDIRMVKALDLKLEAAGREDGVRTICIPSLDADSSLEILSPRAHTAARSSIKSVSGTLEVISCATVEQVLGKVCSRKTLFFASLTWPRLPRDSAQAGGMFSPFGFQGDRTALFWQVLEDIITPRQFEELRPLIASWIAWNTQRRQYPFGLGSGLLTALSAVPPGVLRLACPDPLVTAGECVELSELATQEDRADVDCLFAVAQGRLGRKSDADSEGVAMILPFLLDRLSAKHLAQMIDRPIDEAWASFALDRPIVEESGEFWGVLDAFLVHVLRQTGAITGLPSESIVGIKAKELLDLAFGGEQGVHSALAEAKNGLRGGMRFILDQLAEALKRASRERYIRAQLAFAINPLDGDFRVAFIQSVCDKYGAMLPDEIRAASPERYANHCEEIIRAMNAGTDDFLRVIQTR